MRKDQDPGLPAGWRAAGGPPRPRVIVDFEVDGGELLLVVTNIGAEPAGGVRIRFAPAFRGLGGTLDVPSLPVFSRLAFLAPGRRIEILVDSLAAYLSRREPVEPRTIRAVVTFRDAASRRYRIRIRHDLSIWEHLPRREGGE